MTSLYPNLARKIPLCVQHLCVCTTSAVKCKRPSWGSSCADIFCLRFTIWRRKARIWRGSQLGAGLLGRWMGTICCIHVRTQMSMSEARTAVSSVVVVSGSSVFEGFHFYPSFHRDSDARWVPSLCVTIHCHGAVDTPCKLCPHGVAMGGCRLF